MGADLSPEPLVFVPKPYVAADQPEVEKQKVEKGQTSRGPKGQKSLHSHAFKPPATRPTIPPDQPADRPDVVAP